MEIKPKELGENIYINLDGKNYRLFLKDLKTLAQKYESSSNVNKLNYAIVLYGRIKPYEEVKGWSSRVLEKSGRITECSFVDYDCILLDLVKEELRYVIEKYKLSPFYVFSTYEDTDKRTGRIFGNYICISIAKSPFKKIGEILNELHCDTSYRAVPKSYKWKTYVLRLGKKFDKGPPKFKCIVGDLNRKYSMDCSQAHLELLEQIYPEIKNKVKYSNLDGGHEVFLSEYSTASR